jgi:hypothetical protein
VCANTEPGEADRLLYYFRRLYERRALTVMPLGEPPPSGGGRRAPSPPAAPRRYLTVTTRYIPSRSCPLKKHTSAYRPAFGNRTSWSFAVLPPLMMLCRP